MSIIQYVNRVSFLCALAVASFLCVPNPACALIAPQPLATDSRIKTVPYSPNEVYKFIGHYGYQSSIEFGADEKIMTISLGDSVAWQIKPAGSRLFIKPVEQDALTNMTIITSSHTYSFELHAEETDNIKDKDMTFALRFLYGDSKDGENAGMTIHQDQDPVPDLTDPEVRKTLNFNYSIVGPELHSPIRIFDDGEFTYFEFRDKNGEVPAFFAVDPLQNEAVINFRTVGPYIVVERVAPKFTLRSGAYVICVFNENMKVDPIPQPDKESFWNRLF
jgi:type IV secretion system protein VirB9